ncbi:MAG: hypothetical protein HOP03_16020 [Lysobacter sp.]|nr:hypothetical protein [Lysobacter sp.]
MNTHAHPDNAIADARGALSWTAQRGMLIESDAMLPHDQVRWRPFAGATRPSWIPGRLRALREAEDDAQTVLAFLLTGLATHAIDPAEVVWIVDLAPGEGERAWRVLRALSGRAPRAPPIRYLARSFDAQHHARLAAHPLLKPLLASGDLLLDREGLGIPPQRIRNPIVVLAHEGASAQSQRLYASHAGELREAWSDPDGNLDWRATTQRDGVMRLLSAYRQSLDGAEFTLPHGAMATLSTLLRASGGRLLLRASDHGAKDIAQIRMGALRYGTERASVRHSGAVLQVNFEALARWHRAHGASIHQTQRDDDGRVLHVALHDVAGGRLQECLPDVIGLPHPDDHVQMLLAFETLSAVTPAQGLALLHAQAGDPRALRALSRHIPRNGPVAGGAALCQWRDMLAYCRALHYPWCDGGEEDDEMSAMFATVSRDLEALPPAGRGHDLPAEK